MTAEATHRVGSVRTVTQWVALLFGLWFTVGNYVIGTAIWPGTVTEPGSMHMTHLLGFIPVMVNGWHLYFHLVTGLVCLAAATSHARARIGCLVVGVIYMVTGVVGLMTHGDIYGLIMADTFGNWVHLVEGTGLLLGAWTARTARRTQPRGLRPASG